MRLPGVLLLACCVVLAAPGWAPAQGGAALHVRTADGRTTYYIGERIPLELDFTAPDNKQFEINMASYDRSGRMMHESFSVQPTNGWSDPLADYYGGLIGVAGGGLSSSRVLSPAPTTISFNLNEWVRFDRPGRYRVVLTSHRVAQVNARGSGPFGEGGLALRAEPIELHIVTAPVAWQRAKLAAILDELRAPPAGPGTQPKKRKDAIADLRYLGTPGAIEAMAQHIREDEPEMLYECAFGLAGLPPRLRPVALAAVKKQIDEPTFPVSGWVLQIMPVLQLGSSSVETDSSGLDDAAAQQAAQERMKERERLDAENWQLVLDALPDKTGMARAVTAMMLLQTPRNWRGSQPDPRIGRALAAGLMELPPEQMSNALENYWEALRSPEMLPMLERLGRLPLHDPASNEMHDYVRRAVKAAALRRWYELDPAGAHAEAMRQIGSEHPSLTADALSFLPAEKLPEFEGIWGRALMATDDYQQEGVLLGLMTRFGAGTEAGPVREKAEEISEKRCEPMNPALGYLVKFDPATAGPMVMRGIAMRGRENPCRNTSLQEIARYATAPVLTEAAIGVLDDPDPDVVSDALIYLASYGDASAKEPVWQRYAKWSEGWKGREDVLEHREAGTSGNWQEMGLGSTLASTLISGQGWIADDDLIARVLERCVGKMMCQQLRQIAPAPKPYVVAAFSAGTSASFQVAQYQETSLELFEAKVKQFPRGTKFTMTDVDLANEDQRALEKEVRGVFERCGMALVEAQPPPAVP